MIGKKSLSLNLNNSSQILKLIISESVKRRISGEACRFIFLQILTRDESAAFNKKLLGLFISLLLLSKKSKIQNSQYKLKIQESEAEKTLRKKYAEYVKQQKIKEAEEKKQNKKRDTAEKKAKKANQGI